MMRCHITGCEGFVGQGLCRELQRRRFVFSGSARFINHKRDFPVFVIEDIGPETVWHSALEQTEVIIHLAGRAHVLKDKKRDSIAGFHRVNCAGTLNLAKQAAKIGVRRFIFISSIGVNGASSTVGPFTETDLPTPHSDYAVAKWEAEKGLKQLEDETGMEVVIVRPPLVYGPNSPGNMGRLLRAISKDFPLPFGSVKNQRSFIALDNLVDFIVNCIEHPKAGGEVFLVSDSHDISTPELVHLLAEGMGRSAKLIPIPVGLLRLGFKLFRRELMFQQLCGTLQIDVSKARNLLGWAPQVSVDEALAKTARHFLESQSQ